MIKEEAAPLVIELARNFIALVREIAPDWRKGYLRFCLQGSVSEAKASYVHASGVEIINVLKHKEFFHPVVKKGKELLTALGKEEGVLLLIVDASFDYEIKFEYDNLSRWRISKLGGGTGVPVDIE